MFKDNKKGMADNNNVGGSNRIVAETKIKGEIISKSDFRIDGEVEGDIRTSGRLVIGKSGLIKGKIYCENADVEGRIEGDLQVSNMLTLKATAYVVGDVRVNKLSIEPGATFNVSCSMEDKKKSSGEPTKEKKDDKSAK